MLSPTYGEASAFHAITKQLVNKNALALRATKHQKPFFYWASTIKFTQMVEGVAVVAVVVVVVVAVVAADVAVDVAVVVPSFAVVGTEGWKDKQFI